MKNEVQPHTYYRGYGDYEGTVDVFMPNGKSLSITGTHSEKDMLVNYFSPEYFEI